MLEIRIFTLFALLELCGYSYTSAQITCGQSKLQIVSSHTPELHEYARHFKHDEVRSVLEIPLVYHILYHNENQNLEMDLIVNGIRTLNRAFYYCDYNVPERLRNSTGCPRIQFTFLTDSVTGKNIGIHRKKTSNLSFNDGDSLFILDYPKFSKYGGTEAWCPERVLNIWVVNLSTPGKSNQILAGYAFPPWSDTTWHKDLRVPSVRQGVVVDYRIFQNSSRYKLGIKTLVHEVGHYLGLPHTWGMNENCEDDDGFEDTPLCSAPSNNCIAELSCDNHSTTFIQKENFMDYAGVDCAVMFSNQQCEYMRRAALYFRPYIVSRIYSDNNQQVSIFPNPCTSIVYYSLPSGTRKNTDLKIYLIDHLGVRYKIANWRRVDNFIQMNLANREIGVYNLILYLDDKMYLNRLVKL